MLKNNLFVLLIIIILLSGCSKGIFKTDPVESRLRGTLKKADSFYLKGKSLLNEGKKDAASYYFDRALNILLDLVTADPSNKEKANSYIRKIFIYF